MVSDKGKKVADKSAGKRKIDDDKTGGARKRKNRGVLQFFEDAAASVSDSDYSSGDSIFDDDFMEEEEFDLGPNAKKDQSKANNLPLFPKEEEFEEEFDKMMEERYKNSSSFIRYADDFDPRSLFEKESLMPKAKDPTIWKVKCAVGRERHSAFCLMQKYVDLQALGDKLQIISAFAVDHIKGHLFIEAFKQFDVVESCKGLPSIYITRVTPVPEKEVSHLLSVRTKRAEISEGMWARVKSGRYKGDLAQVVAVNNEKRRVTVKLIPRIDLQALAGKFGGGVPIKRTGAAAPAPRLISSSELEEFRPLIEHRRDRETGKFFEILDGMMLKDGYLYKRVSLDSLSLCGVVPTQGELLKFQPSEHNEFHDVEWLTELYGDKRKKRTNISEKGGEKGGEKGEGPSGSSSAKKYELYDLVSFGRKDFGLIVGLEKDDYKILKEGVEGHIVLNVGVHEIKNGPFEGKFTAMDLHKKPISVNDTVRVLEGPLKDKEGTVKQIYRGIIFVHNGNEAENGGYFCSKAQWCEKVKISSNAFSEKGGEPDLFGDLDNLPSSPKSPLSPEKEKPWQGRENKRDFNQGDREGFSVGQTLRIKIGPLKGYLCRVIAVRRSEVTVKLDSQQKVLTVKNEHLVEVRGRGSAMPMREETSSGLLGNEGSADWGGGAGTSTGGNGWNSGGPSTAWSSWSSLPSSGVPTEDNSVDPSCSAGENKKDVADDGWATKVATKQESSWGTPSNGAQNGGSGKDDDPWSNSSKTGGLGNSASDTWGKATLSSGAAELSSKDGGVSMQLDSCWNLPKSSDGERGASWNSWNKQDGGSSLTKEADFPSKDGDGWGNANLKLKAPVDSTSKREKDENNNWSSWKKPESCPDKGKSGLDSENWGKGDSSKEVVHGGSSWNKPSGGSEEAGGSWKKQDGGSSWGGQDSESKKDGVSSSKQDGSTWNETDAGTWNAPSGGNKTDAGVWNAPSGGSKANPGSSWNNNNGVSSWNKQDGGSSWNKAPGSDAGGSAWAKDDGSSGNKQDGDRSWKPSGGSWGQRDGSSSWSLQTGGSFGHKSGSEYQNTFDGGRGSGGRRGRGGRGCFEGGGSGRFDGGGRGRFGRGRSSDGDQSSGWNNEGGTGATGGWNAGDQSGERKPWSSNVVGGWGCKDKSSDGGSSWNNNQDKGSSWSSQGGGGSWKNAGGNRGGDAAGGNSGGDLWGKKVDFGDVNDAAPGGWKKPDGGSWGIGNVDSSTDALIKDSSSAGSSWKGGDNSGGGWSSKKSFGAEEGSSGGWKKGGGWNGNRDDDGNGGGGERSFGGGGQGFNRGRGFGREDSRGGISYGRGGRGGGSSWNSNKQDNDSSWGNKQGGGGGMFSWGGDRQGGGGRSSWGGEKQDGKSSWSSKQGGGGGGGGGGGDNKLGGGGGENKQGGGGSFWGGGENKQGGGDGGSSWGGEKKLGGGDSSWGSKQGGGDGGGGSSWGGGDKKQGGGDGGGGSSWGGGDKKQGGGGSSWGGEKKQGGGDTSWGSKQGGDGGGEKKQGGDSSWGGSRKELDGGRGRGGKQDEGGSSWNNKKKQDGDSSWGGSKEGGAGGGGSSWGGGGGSSWGS